MNMDGAVETKNPGSYRKLTMQKPTRRCTYIIAAIVVAVMILCIVLVVQLSGKSKDSCPDGLHCNWHSMSSPEYLKDKRCESLCTSQPCIKSVEFALSRIDATKDPCEDFYEFACGKFEQDVIIIPEESEGISIYQEMDNEMMLSLKGIIDTASEVPSRKGYSSLQLMKKVYLDCTNTDDHVDVLTKDIWQKMFAMDGSLPWPLIINNPNYGEDVVVKMMATTLFLDANPFYQISRPGKPSATSSNKRRNWVFDINEQNMEHLKSIYKDIDNTDETSVYNRYRLTIAKILTEIGLDPTKIQNTMPNLISFEKKFMENVKGTESDRDTMSDSAVPCQELDHNVSNKHWCKIARQLLILYGLPDDGNISISVSASKKYFEAVDKILSGSFDRVIVDYIALKVIMYHLKYMPSTLKEMYYADQQLFPRRNQFRILSSRWQQCVDVVAEFLWYPLEREYLKEKFNQQKSAEVLSFANKLKKSFASVVDKMSWLKRTLTPQDPKEFIEKMEILVNSKQYFSLPAETPVDRHFQKATVETVKMDTRKPLIADIVELKILLKKAASNENIYLLDDISLFDIFNPMVTANKVLLQYGLLGFPMYLPGRPMYVEYATFGTRLFLDIIQTLMTEVFMVNNNSSMKVLHDTAQCLQEEVHKIKTGKFKFKTEDLQDHQVNLLTLWNTLATLGSFQAYEDYSENNEEIGVPGLPFTNEQLFFISNAQIHCEKFTQKGYEDFPLGLMVPARYKVNVPLANSEGFSKAFRCSSESAMNPKRKCCLLGDGKMSDVCK